MKTKNYLCKVKRLDDMINAKLEQLEQLKTMSTKITAGFSEKVQSSNISDKVGSTIVKIIDLENEINSRIDELVDFKIEAMRKIDSLENEDYKLLLTLRYLNFKNWEEIAVIMNYSYRQIHRLHGKALKAFEDGTRCHSNVC